MVWAKSQGWETTRCGRKAGSEEAHLAGVEFCLVGKWELSTGETEAEMVRMWVPCLLGYEDTLTPIQHLCHSHRELTLLLTSIKNSKLFVRRQIFICLKSYVILTWSILGTQIRTKAALYSTGQYISQCSIGRKFKDGFNFQTMDHKMDKPCATHLSVFPLFSTLPRKTALGNRDVFGLSCKVCGMCRSIAQEVRESFQKGVLGSSLSFGPICLLHPVIVLNRFT